MKRLNLFLTFLIVLTISSCSSDDDNRNTSNIQGELIVNGKSFELTKGFLTTYSNSSDPNRDPREFYFVLTNGDISYENNALVLSDDITQIAEFEMYSSSESPGSIENITYTLRDYSDQNFDYSNAYISNTGFLTNILIQDGAIISADGIGPEGMDGQVIISVNNGIYNISFSFTSSQNTVSGSYSGILADLNP